MSAPIIVSLLGVASAAAAAASSLHPRLQDGLAQTPPMGWNTYNHYNCYPNETIVRTNAQALVELGLDKLGYRYVTTDCGWSVADRLPDGSLTWNATLFPQGFPALGEYLHELGLLFGVYGDAGILLCGSPPNNTGNLYDNCYSDAATNYPDVNYAPTTSPAPHYATMSRALAALNRTVLFQICDWGVDFPARWAPALGHTWRIGNDILPAWRSIYRIINQAAPQTDVAGPGQWPDLDMLEVGNGVLSVAEEQTHFSLWGILKSPLVIGAALREASEASLAVLMQADVIAFNQDRLGKSARLRRRWSEAGYEVWSGPLAGGRTVAALVNWWNESRALTLELPDIGLQFAGNVRNVWAEGSSVADEGVRTRYTATVPGHGTMLLELGATQPRGEYRREWFAETKGNSTTFSPIYALTTSNNYTLTLTLARPVSTATAIRIDTGNNSMATTLTIPSQTTTLTTPIVLDVATTALTIHHPSQLNITTIHLTPPTGTYHPSTTFTLSGSATLTPCAEGFCLPVGSKIGYLSETGLATHTIAVSTGGTKYVELDYINNDIAFESAWEEGRNARNLTISVNGGVPVRLEVPLSGRHSELFGPGLGWWDTATLGVSVDGWKEGANEVVVGNVGGAEGVVSWGADFVGMRVFD
ncbi:alpha-galactosidase D [Aspergillus saccharolyticus JOP 1030-1]|uniref:Alpha-galactosidase n=1 Tax=Aspergillus saccharolyticus JOP 1030-1 TaxID=1450539 RepID=A0A318Z796_9EURO|nr:putative alpha-galactosidase D [Aspergillus saccharolyticus JOP 1030-1]PYH42979.1 putative alpha-galactosidase D [Aspergillus saccharolyticus JOP 1030-1]